jgi:hypothetical protein
MRTTLVWPGAEEILFGDAIYLIAINPIQTYHNTTKIILKHHLDGFLATF